MWPSRSKKLRQLDSGLQEFSKKHHKLLGIANAANRNALVLQMIASLRRLDYTRLIKSRDITPHRADPKSDLFEPERAAALLARNGKTDEAIWLIFLATHFGQHGKHGWRLLREVYSGLGGGVWSWSRVSADPSQFRAWLKQNFKNVKGAFGNHRKYETLNPESNSGTSHVIESFVECFQPSPSKWFGDLARLVGNDPHTVFDAAYNSVTIARFGRLAKFDFLALLGRLDLAAISPGSAYLSGATGPLRGARLLVDGNTNSTTSAADLDAILQELDGILDVGMQVMEDSICNWQKSPNRFVHFRG
jgi:alpha-glutamyl/putrescinyl thymine pyrophosphorylase-like protein